MAPAPVSTAQQGPGFGRLTAAKQRHLSAWRTYQCRASTFGYEGECFADPSKIEAQAVEKRLEVENAAAAQEEAKQGRERIVSRCAVELAKPPSAWQFIGLNFFASKPQERRAPGMFYGLEFPWNVDLLVEFGPEWLTKAFHAAGTLDANNSVTAVIPERRITITAGNNAAKILFEVRYAKPTADLHTKLFAKIPFPLSGTTTKDRQSSSVYKQPMDFHEINTYRLLESCMPVKVPKYYYGDISNETSNYILITERVPFAEINGPRKGTMAPLEIEGPYQKCKDWMLRGPAKDYYILLIRKHAQLAAAHKKGQMGSQAALEQSLRFAPTSVEAYAVNPDAPTGEKAETCSLRLEEAIKFFAGAAKVVFPSYVTSDAFQRKFRATFLKLNAYSGEIQYWKHKNPDYVAFGHQNLNMDNAYFWRGVDGALDCGIFDFGGFGSSSLPHRLWWGLNCAEFDQIKENLSEYIDSFIALYTEFGGPRLDKSVMRTAIIITALENTMFMVRAVPDCLEQCPEEEWSTIRDRHDPRVSSDVGGKSTLRTTLQVMTNGLRILEELQADQVLDAWVRDVYGAEFGKPPKGNAVVMGA